jgi:uncharacterized membrane-anchored protein YhcB (DUF1043 family)
VNAYATELYVLMLISFLIGSAISLVAARIMLPTVKQLEKQNKDVLEGRK